MKRKEYRDAYVAAHISNTVAAQISMMREARAWTQKQLAEKAGMKQSRVSLLEDPDYENFEAGTLRRIASAFDVGLSIRFEPFSAIVRGVSDISDEKLLVADFENDALDGKEVLAGVISPIRTDSAVTFPKMSATLEPRGVPNPNPSPLIFRNDNGMTIVAIQ